MVLSDAGQLVSQASRLLNNDERSVEVGRSRTHDGAGADQVASWRAAAAGSAACAARLLRKKGPEAPALSVFEERANPR